jgi:methylenetetrahydrofolate reductase (NADPH)
MFFDNAKYFEFVAKAREMGITVPIIPGSHWQYKDIYKYYRKFFRIDLPEDLIDAVDACKTNADVKQVELNGHSAITRIERLVFLFCIIIYGKSENIRQIVSLLF